MQHRFSNIFFDRTSDCSYQYNLDTGLLPGPGDYSVEMLIDFKEVPLPALFKVQ